ncbi:MAG: hypothetical protein WCR60_03075 [Patescibacteria group bacterium]
MTERKQGIPGITHPLGESADSWKDYAPSAPKDHGLNQLIQAPKEIVVTGLQAALGALSLTLGRTLGIRDVVAQAEKDLAIYEAKRDRGKGNLEKIQAKIDEKTALLAGLNEGVNLSEQILQIKEKYQALLDNDNYLLLLLSRTVGNEGLVEIEKNFTVSQRTEATVKPITAEEIELSQQFLAKSDNSEQRNNLLKQYIKQLEKANLINLGKQLVNLAKIQEVTQIKNDTDFNINLVSWGEALLASIMGATGRTENSIRGGYKVGIKNGNLLFSEGKDSQQIASMEKITVAYDLPRIYESALSVANAEVPLLKSEIISNLIKKALGDNSLLPGRIDIGQTGSGISKSYPALNIQRQMDNVDMVRVASLEMKDILAEIEQIDLDEDDDQETKIKKLINSGIKGVLKIPRYQVIVDLMNQINPKIIEGLSNQYRFIPEEEVEEETDFADDGSEQNPLNSEEQAEFVEFDQKQVNLIQAGFAKGIDQRTAILIVEHPEAYLAYFIEQFGKKEGKRIMKTVMKEARSILQIDWDSADDFEEIGKKIDLYCAGYDEMNVEQARDFIYKLQDYRKKLIAMYGEAQGNRITNQVKSIAKNIIYQDEQQAESLS